MKVRLMKLCIRWGFRCRAAGILGGAVVWWMISLDVRANSWESTALLRLLLNMTANAATLTRKERTLLSLYFYQYNVYMEWLHRVTNNVTQHLHIKIMRKTTVSFVSDNHVTFPVLKFQQFQQFQIHNISNMSLNKKNIQSKHNTIPYSLHNMLHVYLSLFLSVYEIC